MSLAPRDLITENLELLSLPEIVVRINAMIDDPECSAVDIAEVIGQDAGLTARLLKLVNSPFYNFPSQVDTISMAITIVGTRQLRDIAMAAAITGRFRQIPGDLVSPDVFWQHNLACATAARVIARESTLRDGQHEQLFVAGLLHDIGKMVMYLTCPDLARQVLDLARDPDTELATLEQRVFGFTHGEVGAELLRAWRLPESLVAPTRWHHDPGAADDYPMESATIHLANAIANTVAPPVSPDDDLPIDLGVWSTLGLDPAVLDDLIRETETQLPGIVAIFYEAA